MFFENCVRKRKPSDEVVILLCFEKTLYVEFTLDAVVFDTLIPALTFALTNATER
jgi:hypothetical protein